MIITGIKTKADAMKVMALKEIQFAAEIEVSNDTHLKEAAAKATALLRQKKRLHVLILEQV